jgi:hypothetical protein
MIQDSKHSVGDTGCACWSKEHEVEDEADLVAILISSILQSLSFDDASTELIESGKVDSAFVTTRPKPVLQTANALSFAPTNA